MSNLDDQNVCESSPKPQHFYDFMPKEDIHDDSMLAQGQQQANELAVGALLLIWSIILRYDNKYIRALYEGLSQSMLIYLKPYSKRIYNLKITIVINFLSFYNFDEKGYVRIFYYVETCNNANTEGNFLIKYFVHFV